MKHFAAPSHHALPVAALTVALLISMGCSVFGSQSVEEAGYEVLRAEGPFELREYDELVLAVTLVSAPLEEAQRIAFGRLFDYISGDNVARSKIAMTAPVIAEEVEAEGTKIAMTAPVLSEESADGWRVAFVLPASFTIETAPLPNEPLVSLVRVPSKTVAAIRYSGSRGEESFREHESELLGWIDDADLEPVSATRSAGYDPPWTLPPMRRNEVLIDVQPAG